MRLRIFSVCYGLPFIGLFAGITLRSLMQPRNIPALLDEGWDVVLDIHTSTDPLSLAQLRRIGGLLNGVEVEITPHQDNIQTAAFAETAAKAAAAGEPVLFAQSDTFFCDGFVTALVNQGQQHRGRSIFVPHMRVVEEIFSRIIDDLLPLDWQALATLAVRTLHPEHVLPTDLEQGYTVLTRTAADSLCLEHRNPTPYLIHFTEEDAGFLEAPPDARLCIDGSFAERLYGAGRARMVEEARDLVCVELRRYNNYINLDGTSSAPSPYILPEITRMEIPIAPDARLPAVSHEGDLVRVRAETYEMVIDPATRGIRIASAPGAG